jgi:hypothetical protein
LEVEQQHSLVRLAPVLGQLPQLQHLAVQVSMVSRKALEGSLVTVLEGVFTDEDEDPLKTVPDLGQLCPQLTQLRLIIRPDSHLSTGWPLDGRLPRLLPGRLQQLALISSPSPSQVVPTSLSHLNALQQLTLHGVQVVGPGGDVFSSQLDALQELRLECPPEMPFVLQVASQVKAYRSLYARAVNIAAMGQLTSLQWHVLEGWGASEGPPENIVAALGALTGLRELELTGVDGSMGSLVLRSVAGMAQLRSLQLGGSAELPD